MMVVETAGIVTGDLKVLRTRILHRAFAEVKVRRSRGIAYKWVPEANRKAMEQQHPES
jgi:hypothetical protein